MTATLHRALPAQISSIGPREFRAIASNSDVGRDGLRLLTSGLDITEYMANPVLLFSHDMTKPVGRCLALRASGDDLIGRFEFAPLGVSATADEACGLVKNDCLSSLSCGFDINEIDPPKAGARIVKKSTLIEISIVAIPALVSAKIIERSHPLSDRAQVLLEAARDHLSEARQHCDTIRDCLDRGTLTAAEAPHSRMFSHLRSAGSMLDETADRDPPPGRRLTDARRHVRGAITAHRTLADGLDEKSVSRCRAAHGDLDRALRNAATGVADLLDDRSAVTDGKLGKLADFGSEGTSKTLAETYSDAGSDAGQHAYLPLSIRAANHAHMHQLAVSGCSSMIPRARAADTGVDATFAARQADLQRLGNRSWNPKAKAAALARLFR